MSLKTEDEEDLKPSSRIRSPHYLIKPRGNPVPLSLRVPKEESDEDNEKPLMIDERKHKLPTKSIRNEPRGPIKLRLSGIHILQCSNCKVHNVISLHCFCFFFLIVGSRTDHFQFAETTEVAANMDVETGEHKVIRSNKTGIDHLLRASNVGPLPLEDLG